MTLERFGIQAVRAIDRVTDIAIEIVLCVMLLFGAYSLWDSNQVYQQADAARYAAYRPSAEDTVSFDELRAMNPEVFAWLTVIDTPIDYPMTQAGNNEKYINTNAEGAYTLSGSIFLDYRNSPAFDDFNSIVYGHHMEKKRMFGSLSDFAEREYFDSHPYGNLFFDGKDHGIQFFALVLTDAYDKTLFTPVADPAQRQAYLNLIDSTAVFRRDIPVTTEDQIIQLSTCTSTITNGRYMLIGKLTDDTFLQPEAEPRENRGTGLISQAESLMGLPLWVWICAAAVFVILLWIVIRTISGRNRPERKRK